MSNRLGGPSGRVRRVNDSMDASLFMLFPAIFTNIWYWQLVIPGLSALKLGLVSVVGAFIAYAMNAQKLTVLKLPEYRPVKFIVILGVLATIGGPFAIVRGAALDFVLYMFIPTVTLAFLVAARIRSVYSLSKVIDAVLIGSLPYAFAFIRAPVDNFGKPYGMPFYDANDGAMLATICFVLALGRMALTKSMVTKGVLLLLSLMHLYVVVKSTSRGAFLTMVVVGLVLLFTVNAISVKRRVMTAVTAAVLMLGAGSSAYWEYMGTILNPQDDYNWAGNSDTGRMELWKRGLIFISEDPILGSGAMNYRNKQGRSEWARQMELEGRGAAWNVAHNAYIEVGAELGIPGLITWLAILFGTKSRMWKAGRLEGANKSLRVLCQFLFACLSAYAFGSIFLSSQYWTFYFVLISICCASAAVLRQSMNAGSHVTVSQPRSRTRRAMRPRRPKPLHA